MYLEYYWEPTKSWERLEDKMGCALVFENVDQRWAAEQTAMANPNIKEVRFVYANQTARNVM